MKKKNNENGDNKYFIGFLYLEKLYFWLATCARNFAVGFYC